MANTGCAPSTQHQNQPLNAWKRKFNSPPMWRTNKKAYRDAKRETPRFPPLPPNIPHGSGTRVMETVTPARTKGQRKGRGGGQLQMAPEHREHLRVELGDMNKKKNNNKQTSLRPRHFFLSVSDRAGHTSSLNWALGECSHIPCFKLHPFRKLQPNPELLVDR